MSNVFFSTRNGERHGRSSHFFKNQAAAQAAVDSQNARAEKLEIVARYELGTCLEADVPAADKIR